MIEIRNVSKCFGETQAVSRVSLTLREANVFGMLGTNGAGKSTLLRMMAGILRPDEGEILIDGESVWDNPEVKRKFSVSTGRGEKDSDFIQRHEKAALHSAGTLRQRAVSVL